MSLATAVAPGGAAVSAGCGLSPGTGVVIGIQVLVVGWGVPRLKTGPPGIRIWQARLARSRAASVVRTTATRRLAGRCPSIQRFIPLCGTVLIPPGRPSFSVSRPQ